MHPRFCRICTKDPVVHFAYVGGTVRAPERMFEVGRKELERVVVAVIAAGECLARNTCAMRHGNRGEIDDAERVIGVERDGQNVLFRG